jgi:hypothetical protein
LGLGLFFLFQAYKNNKLILPFWKNKNWAIDWQNSHIKDVDWYDCGSEHSQPLNANLKAYAAWALWTAIATKQ